MKKENRQPTTNDMERTIALGNPVKRAWRSPELTEVDYDVTESNLTFIGTDGPAYS